MDVLRTPDERFSDLPGYDFEPNYTDITDPDAGALRVHHIEAGPADGPVVLLLHGEPSWCYLYRKMLPVLAGAGYRAIAPDLIGFGRSDKLTPRTEYSYARHVAWMWSWIEAMGLQDITLFGQDWGGLIGLRIVGEHPDRFVRVVAGNTFLPTGEGKPSEAFLNWRRFSQDVETFPTGFIINGGCTSDLSPEVTAAYDAPFPDESYKEGARQFPVLVPISPDDPASAPNKEAWKVLEQFDRPFLCAFSDGDPITAGNERHLIERIPGCAGQPHTTITGGGHFLQEDKGEELANVIVNWVEGLS